MFLLRKILDTYSQIDSRNNESISGQILSHNRIIVTTIHPYSYIKLRKQIQIVKELDFIFVDSSLMIRIIDKILKKNYPSICFNFTHISVREKERFFAKEFFESLKVTDSLAIIGSEKKICENAAQNIQTNYKNSKIVYISKGIFGKPEEMKIVLEEILVNKPTVIICGMGTILQESFLLALKRKNWEGIGLCVGGFIHQISKRLNYYPILFEKMNIRWLFRILDEPRLLFRYILVYPFSVLVLIYDCLKLKISVGESNELPEIV
ncbi:MAG: WecB/TagA/CpsF family glycosyltransferase [Melioribacteraceae bacterium]